MNYLGFVCLVFLVLQVAADQEENYPNEGLQGQGSLVKKRLLATFVLCEGKSGTLRCPGRKRLKISYANYGRTEEYICPSRSMKTSYCISSYSHRLIRCSCTGRNSCPLYAKNQVFGDPCKGTYKYIKVLYRCV